MRKLKQKVLCFALATTMAGFAAPLFPDVPDAHWAKDAVAATLAEIRKHYYNCAYQAGV